MKDFRTWSRSKIHSWFWKMTVSYFWSWKRATKTVCQQWAKTWPLLKQKIRTKQPSKVSHHCWLEWCQRISSGVDCTCIHVNWWSRWNVSTQFCDTCRCHTFLFFWDLLAVVTPIVCSLFHCRLLQRVGRRLEFRRGTRCRCAHVPVRN